MALSAAACAEKYSINDCEANLAIAARKLNAELTYRIRVKC
jgi:hypothetical protein